jgi:hypothetical protein
MMSNRVFGSKIAHCSLSWNYGVTDALHRCDALLLQEELSTNQRERVVKRKHDILETRSFVDATRRMERTSASNATKESHIPIQKRKRTKTDSKLHAGACEDCTLDRNMYIDQWVNIDTTTRAKLPTPFYKIGKGRPGREALVSGQNPFRYPVVARFKGMAAFEYIVHRKLEHVNMKTNGGREWFDFSTLVDDPLDANQVKTFVWQLISKDVIH